MTQALACLSKGTMPLEVSSSFLILVLHVGEHWKQGLGGGLLEVGRWGWGRHSCDGSGG